MATKMIENRSDLELNELKVFCVGTSSPNNMNDNKDYYDSSSIIDSLTISE
jgi:hypothetical protein